MGRVRTWLRPELAIGAAGIVILGLVVVQLVLIQYCIQACHSCGFCRRGDLAATGAIPRPFDWL